MAPHTSNSVLKKLFLMLTGLVLVVLTALVSLFTVYIRQQREAEISSQVNRVTNSAAIIAERFNAVFTAQTQLLNDKRVAKLAHGLYTDNYEKTTLILDLLAAMQNMQSLNGIIEDIIITLPAQGLELSVKNDYQKKTYVSVEIPFGCTAEVQLPYYSGAPLGELAAGCYDYTYQPTVEVRAKYTAKTMFKDMLHDEAAMTAIKENCPILAFFLGTGNEDLLCECCETLVKMEYMGFRREEIARLQTALAAIIE